MLQILNPLENISLTKVACCQLTEHSSPCQSMVIVSLLPSCEQTHLNLLTEKKNTKHPLTPEVLEEEILHNVHRMTK